MKTLKALAITAALTAALAVTTARAFPQSYHDRNEGWQNYQAPSSQYGLSQAQGLNPPAPCDMRQFDIKPLPPVQSLYPQGPSGVIIGPNGQNYYWFQNGR